MTSAELLTRESLAAVTVLEKHAQITRPVMANNGYGISPLGSWARLWNTKVNTATRAKGCARTHATPRMACRYRTLRSRMAKKPISSRPRHSSTTIP